MDDIRHATPDFKVNARGTSIAGKAGFSALRKTFLPLMTCRRFKVKSSHSLATIILLCVALFPEVWFTENCLSIREQLKAAIPPFS